MLGPDPDRPDVAVSLDEPYGQSTDELGEPMATKDVAGWWRRFGDESTTELVELALRENYDLRAATARALRSRALLDQATASLFPTIGLDGSAARSQSSFVLPDFSGTGGGSQRVQTQATTFNAGLNVSWQVDLWGKLRRGQQAAGFEAAASLADRQALQHTIVANVIQTRVAISTLQQRLSFAEANLESLRSTLDSVQRRFDAGVGNAVELRLARENIESAAAQIPPLRSQLATQLHSLAVLTGRRPAAVEGLPATLEELPTLPPPPLELPAALLDQRPDLIASELRAKATQARIGVAVADLLPQLNLAGSLGFQSSDASDLFDGDSEVWSLLAQVVQPIFEGGRRRAVVDEARAAADAQAADYVGLILQAMKEVEDALATETSARQEVAFRKRALGEAELAEDLARRQFSQGLSTLLTVFEAERRRRGAEEALLLSRQNVWLARINLHLALGGDWDLSMPPAEPATLSTAGGAR